jgi:heme-degrading monooxygenase HmoA
MIMTVLEAYVEQRNWNKLIVEYNYEIKNLDPGIIKTFLVQNTSDPTLWQIITVWESMEALTAMRQSGETPRGVKMFAAAGAEPQLMILEVHSWAEAGS